MNSSSALMRSALPTSIPIPSFVTTTYSIVWYYVNWILFKLPGGQYILNYLKKSTHDDPYRTTVEIGLILYGIYYYLSKPQQKKGLQSNRPNLSKQEIDALIEDWEPESMVNSNELDLLKQDWRLAKIPVIINGGVTNYINFTRNDDEESFSNIFNLSSNNFLQISSKKEVIKRVKDSIRYYGVGACGPAGFYGNQDVHYNLEYDLAKFFGTEAAVLYGQDFCVTSSVLPAFTKRGDIIVADDQVSLSVQNALQLSRSTVYYFEHNNMNSLDQLLTELNKVESKENLPELPRKFIVTEALFHNSGDIAPLPELVELKLKHKYRLLVDETISLGVLGETGRGLPEYFGLKRPDSIDVTVGSLATAIGSSGGFVLGDKVMSDHQHIGSNAYCFSASLPGYCVAAASKVLEIMNDDNSAVLHLQKLSKLMFKSFMASMKSLDQFIIIKSEECSPILHIELNAQFRYNKFGYTKEDLFDTISALQKRCATSILYDPFEMEERFLQEIVDDVLVKYNTLITRNTLIIQQETLPIVPSLKICCNADMSEDELAKACENIKESIIRLCNGL